VGISTTIIQNPFWVLRRRRRNFSIARRIFAKGKNAAGSINQQEEALN
jgi:hypothetical protein